MCCDQNKSINQFIQEAKQASAARIFVTFFAGGEKSAFGEKGVFFGLHFALH